LTQPAVSKQMKALEDHLGVHLFVRCGHGVALTPAGQRLLEYATKITRLAEEAAMAVEEFRTSARGHLRIGTSMTVGSYLLPRILSEYCARHPGYRVSVAIANSEGVLDRITAGTVDVGLVGIKVRRPNLVALPFWRDELKLIVGPQHPWATSPPATAASLAGQLFILREKGSGMRKVFDEWLTATGTELGPVMEIANTEAILRLVEIGMGVSVLSDFAIARSVALGTVKALSLPFLSIERDFYLVHGAHEKPREPLKSFVEFLTERFRGSAEATPQ
ncbi:MAG: LysR family transcriptional regulator, partial [Firmicutes bacterium]|nr:LysR family transcriptional regulator [Bacillota bacterium]